MGVAVVVVLSTAAAVAVAPTAAAAVAELGGGGGGAVVPTVLAAVFTCHEFDNVVVDHGHCGGLGCCFTLAIVLIFTH